MPITEKPKFKFPKTPGLWPDLLYELKQKRLAIQKQADAIEEEEKALKEHIINTLPKSEASGVSGKNYKVAVIQKMVPQVDSWDDFYKHILKTKDFGYLNRALNKGHVEEVWDAGKQVPGVKAFQAVTVSLTKI